MHSSRSASASASDLGDRHDGQDPIALDTILNHETRTCCAFLALSPHASGGAKVVATLREKDAMRYTVVVVTEGDNPPGLIYIAPYAATSIANISWSRAAMC